MSKKKLRVEWLTSDIVYYGKQNEMFKEFACNNFSESSLYYHYKSLCRNNYLKYIKSGNDITYKRYLYAMRGLINASWVIRNHSVPPIIFTDAVKGIDSIPNSVVQILLKIIEIKSLGKEKNRIEHISSLDEHIEAFLENELKLPKKLNPHLDELNNELRRIILNQN
ncbi:MAG: DNA polymerase beta superfamily protein [Candidatus Hodarchaeota archaeon]